MRRVVSLKFPSLKISALKLGAALLTGACMLVLLAACSSGGGEDGTAATPGVSTPDTSAGGEDQRATGDLGAFAYTTLCGVTRLERLVNPLTDGEFVTVEVLSSDKIVIVRTNEDQSASRQLVKLQKCHRKRGKPVSGQNGIDVLQRRLAEGAVFIDVGEGCEYVENGAAVGVLGQVFSMDGQSMSELMLQEGAVAPAADICEGEVLSSCYQTIGFNSRPPTDIELDVVSVGTNSVCGAIKDETLIKPVTQAEDVAVEVVDVDQVIVTRLRGIEAGNQQAIRLHGITTEGIPPFRQLLGRSLLESETAGGAFLVVAGQSCAAALPGGGSGVYGQLYSRAGVSINEALIAGGSAVPAAQTCGGQLLTPCYQSIPVTAPPPGEEPPSDEVISDFLWKPVSESNGNLAILVNPEGVRVVINGEVTESPNNAGPSNGRGSTLRSGRPGCAYGNEVRVEFFDSQDKRIYVANGEDAVIVPRGCDRYEFRL